MITTITNHKGGTGKTTFLQNLAIMYALNKKKVLVIDLDTQKNLSFVFNNLNTEYNIYNLLNNEVYIEKCIYQTNVKNIDIIGGSKILNQLNLDFTTLASKLNQIKNNYDYILIDTPPQLSTITAMSCIASDNILIPTLADIYSIQGLIDINTFINEIVKPYNPNIYIKGLVLIKYTDRFKLNKRLYKQIEQVADILKSKVFKTTIRESILIRECQNEKTSPLIKKPNSPISNDFKSLYKELLKND